MQVRAIESELNALVEGERERLNIPGVAIGISVGDDEWYGSYGVTNVSAPVPVSEATRFQIGSISKTVTATALMVEVDAGRIALDQPVRDLLPEFELSRPGAAEQVLVRHLVTHVGGWDGDWLLVHPAGGRGDDALAGAVASMVQAPMITAPGSLFHYNNAGFSIAGRLIEVARGAAFEEVIAESILGPVGLERAVFFAADAISGSVAAGHIVRAGRPEVAPLWELSRCDFPAGGIACDIHDLLRWGRFHLGDGAGSGRAVLAEPSLRLMHEPQVPIGDTADAVGLAWMIGRAGAASTLSHSGGTNGQISLLTLLAEQDAVIGVVTNADTGGALTQRVTRFVQERLLALVVEDPEPIDLGDALDAYTGSYEREMQRLAVTREGAQLLVQATSLTRPAGWEAGPQPPPMRIDLVESDAYASADRDAARARGRFIRDDGGAIEFLRWGGRLHAKR